MDEGLKLISIFYHDVKLVVIDCLARTSELLEACEGE